MKIVYLILGTFNSGGMERVLCNKANWLTEIAGHSLFIITTDQQGRTPFFNFSSRITHYDLGINYTDLKGFGIAKKTIGYIQKQRLHKSKLSVLLQELQADIVISMFGPEVGFLYQIQDGSRKILEIHFSKYFRMQQARGGLWWVADKWRSIQDQKYIRKYDKFVVLTHEDKTYWGNHANIEVIHNASTFIPSTQATLDNKRVISVGRLTHQKGYDMLVEAWRLVNARHPDWRLTLVGSGEEQEKLQAQIQRLGLSNVIQLLSPTPMIEKEYLDSSIYVLSSRYEGLPMVLLEVMSCGVPAVAFACKCGPRDVITNEKDGLLICPYNIAELAEGICRLIENPYLRRKMGVQAKEIIRHKFSENTIMEQWNTLLNTIAAKRRNNHD